MSQVFARNRKEAETDYISLAVDIRIEVLRLIKKEDVIPRRHTFTFGQPMAESARSLVLNVNRANRFYPSNSFNVMERKRYLGLALADCDQIEQDMQCAVALGFAPPSKFESVIGMLGDEIEKLTRKRKYTKVIGRESTASRLDAARKEVERLEAIAADEPDGIQ